MEWLVGISVTIEALATVALTGIGWFSLRWAQRTFFHEERSYREQDTPAVSIALERLNDPATNLYPPGDHLGTNWKWMERLKRDGFESDDAAAVRFAVVP